MTERERENGRSGATDEVALKVSCDCAMPETPIDKAKNDIPRNIRKPLMRRRPFCSGCRETARKYPLTRRNGRTAERQNGVTREITLRVYSSRKSQSKIKEALYVKNMTHNKILHFTRV